MFLKNQIIGAIVASALVASPVFAVEGSDGMYYTSASEGLYASIRARFNTADKKDGNSSVVGDSGSNIGIQGTGEMSHGLEAFYRYELSVGNVGTDGLETSKSFVGLRGGFGEIRLGKHDLVEHDWVSARTDFTNNGNRPSTFNISDAQAIQYKSPDFNGLQIGAAFHMPGGDGGSGTPINTTVSYVPEKMGDIEKGIRINKLMLNAMTMMVLAPTKDGLANPENDLNAWTLAANYSFGGFNVGGSYAVVTDGLAKTETAGPAGDKAKFLGFEDQTSWGVSGSYGQENWTVATFYKEVNLSDRGTGVVADPDTDSNGEFNDQSYFSVAGQVDIGKTRVIVTHDTTELSGGLDDAATTFEVEYRLNSKAKAWIGYTSSDRDSDPDAEDDFYIGLRHDF